MQCITVQYKTIAIQQCYTTLTHTMMSYYPYCEDLAGEVVVAGLRGDGFAHGPGALPEVHGHLHHDVHRVRPQPRQASCHVPDRGQIGGQKAVAAQRGERGEGRKIIGKDSIAVEDCTKRAEGWEPAA